LVKYFSEYLLFLNNVEIVFDRSKEDPFQ